MVQFYQRYKYKMTRKRKAKNYVETLLKLQNLNGVTN